MCVCLILCAWLGREQREKLLYDAIWQRKRVVFIGLAPPFFLLPYFLLLLLVVARMVGGKGGKDVCVVGCLLCCVWRDSRVLYIIYIPYLNLDGEIVQSNRHQKYMKVQFSPDLTITLPSGNQYHRIQYALLND